MLITCPDAWELKLTGKQTLVQPIGPDAQKQHPANATEEAELIHNLNTIGVIGAGVMGTGVAQNLAQTGHRVILVDISDGILQTARQQIANSIRMQKLLNRNGGQKQDGEALKMITFSTRYEPLEEADFVIENVTENAILKTQVYGQLDAVCPPRSCFAVNTSAIPITQIASKTKRPSKVLGIHFMNPVPLKKTVEVIPGFHTAPETIEVATTLLSRMGKDWIIVNDSPGFVSNRVLMLTINEAVFLAQEKVAAVEDIDKLFRACFGHAMGPLETADLIGLDTILNSLEVLWDQFQDSKYRPCPLLKKMVSAGLHGRKSGQGFYVYA
jgi:3-hydroxybutyryl-CoA dehydrogenase